MKVTVKSGSLCWSSVHTGIVVVSSHVMSAVTQTNGRLSVRPSWIPWQPAGWVWGGNLGWGWVGVFLHSSASSELWRHHFLSVERKVRDSRPRPHCRLPPTVVDKHLHSASWSSERGLSSFCCAPLKRVLAQTHWGDVVFLSVLQWNCICSEI